jgi:CHASE3 domain sensor protein
MLPSSRGLFPTVAISLALIALFVAAGALTHRYVQSAGASLERVYDVRQVASDTLTRQLDEETGIRGLAATGDPLFLQPYQDATQPLARDFAELHDGLAALSIPGALETLQRAKETSETWVREVARPTLAHPRSGAKNVQRFGKRLMDSFRGDIANLNVLLRAREDQVKTELGAAVDRITFLVAAAAGVLSLAAIVYTLQQMRASRRIAEQERLAEDERRRSAEMEAAYVAEKRIADSLQTAFSQRPLPALETLRFSASYVPATEETRLGGDWYDVIALPGNKVLFTIGDVTGHGIDAAVTMNRARQSFVTGALFDVEPGSVLERVNNEMAEREDRLVTAIAGVADASTFEFVYAVAGHPPPVLFEPGREPRFLDCGSLPLGVAEIRVDAILRDRTRGSGVDVLDDDARRHGHAFRQLRIVAAGVDRDLVSQPRGAAGERRDVHVLAARVDAAQGSERACVFRNQGDFHGLTSESNASHARKKRSKP